MRIKILPKKLNKFISITLLLAMFISLVPVEIGEALADKVNADKVNAEEVNAEEEEVDGEKAEGEKAKEGDTDKEEKLEKLVVEELTIKKNFNREQETESMNLTIEGENLSDAKVLIYYGPDVPMTLYNQQRELDVSYFNFVVDIKKGDFEKLVNIEKINIISGKQKITIPLSDKEKNAILPEINSVTRKVNTDKEESLIIKGNNFHLFEQPNVNIKYGNGIDFAQIKVDKGNTLKGDSKENYYIDYNQFKESFLGLNDLQVVKEFNTSNSEDNKDKGIKVKIFYNYKDQFRLVKNLDVPEDLEMYPFKGKPGSIVYFESESWKSGEKISDFDVFFVNKLNEDAFQEGNKGTDMKKDELAGYVSVKVPNIPVDDYYVILTNKIQGADPSKEVKNEKVMEIDDIDDNVKPLIFKVTEKDVSATILDIEPKVGPDTGTSVTIKGGFLGSLNIDDLIISGEVVIDEIKKAENDDTVLEIKYRLKSDDGGITYKGNEVNSIVKNIKVMIGKEAAFEEGSQFSPGMDVLQVRTPRVTVEGDPEVDVIVTTETVLTVEEGENARKFKIKDRAVKHKGFKFISSTLKPDISQIIPVQIFVDDKNMIVNKTLLAIEGENFLVTKVEGDTRYPKVRFKDTNDKEIVFDPNESKDVKVLVLNGKGQVVDGSLGNEIGSKILLTIPSESKIEESFIDTKVPVYVINPIRNSKDEGLLSDENVNAQVQFIKYDENKAPTIKDVKPDVVPVEGGETVTITGSNFKEDVKLNLDGNEITKFDRTGEGTKITFTAPKGREGMTQLQVLNPNGGMAVWDFKYIKTYTNPKILSFAPNRGRTGTMVVLKGENFLAPDPTATEYDVSRLIGTRVFLGNQDINDYNRDSGGKKIKLKRYSPAKDKEIVKIKKDGMQKRIEIADYWHSVIFKDENGKFYTLRPDAKDVPVLTNGIDWTYDFKLKGNDIFAYPRDRNGEYKVEVCSGKKVEEGNKDSDDKEKEVGKDNNKDNIANSNEGNETISDTVTEKSLDEDENKNHKDKNSEKSNDNNESEDDNGKDVALKLLKDDGTTHLTLTMLTPYKVEGTEIVGSRVKVLDSNRIYFWVPILNEGDGWYDVTVLNPDTKKDSRTGKQGFEYFTQPQSKPKMNKITPEKGSTDGGYTIDIIGSEFKDDGFEKSRVFIGGVEVKPDDVKVGVTGNLITVKVPPFDAKFLKDNETDRITVPVVVVNPDGGTANKEYGFTYMVPTSHPKINRIIPNKGSAAGKEVVEIFGRDFRYYEPYSDDNRNGQKDENEPFMDLNGNGKWDDFRLDAVKKKLGKKYKDEKDLMQNLKDNIKVYSREDEEDKASFEDIVLPVLPKVYFGDKIAEIIEFSDGYLKVVTPDGKAKAVDLYVVNNDAGVSNKVKYTYEASNPSISKIVPIEGKKQGGDKIEIFGRRFVKSDIKVVESESPITQVLVRFGDISNHDIPREKPDSGRIDNRRTTIELPGGLKVAYNGDQNNLYVEIKEGGKTYAKTFKYSEDDGVIYFPTRLLKSGKIDYPYNELVRLEIKDRRLLVERGYAPEVNFQHDGQLVVTTPSYYTIGEVDVTIINPDSGMAQGKFIYKNPDSNPRIINVTKEGEGPKKEKIRGKDVQVIRVTYKGGHIISVIGSDFRENAKISIGSVAEINPNQITYMLPSKLTFKMPRVSADAVGKLHRVVVTNEDGGIAVSDDSKPPIYIMFIKGETGPIIENLTPDKGTSLGGNKIKIEGKDFREGLKLYWGGKTLPEDSFKVVDYKTIIVEVPPHAAGKVEVKVENPDGELSNLAYYTYLSSPKISAVVDPRDSTETKLITRISAEGGEVIKVKGNGFLSGARVLFNPTIKRVDDEDITKGTIIYIDGNPYLLEGGVDGTDVEVIDSETINVTTPPGKVGTGGIIIINSDTGATEIYEDIKYVLPELMAPEKVVAELVYDRYIKVHWGPVEKATSYDVYVVVDDNEIEFVGSTDITSFVFSDLESNTRYKFIVKAIGRFGSSQPSAQSNSVKTKRRVGPPDDDGKIDDKTTKRVEGDKAIVSIGTEDYKDNLTIDFAELNMHGAKKVIINIPARVISKGGSGEITVYGKDFTLKFYPSVFETERVKEYRNRSDAGVRFEIAPYNGSTNLMDKTALSTQYMLKADFFLGKDLFPIEDLVSTMSLVAEYDSAKANLRRLKNIKFVKYDGYRDRWKVIPQSNLGTSIRTYIDRMGRFLIVGGRR